jgi:23S rRNA (uridine2552-2'-O)-methyltransferase
MFPTLRVVSHSLPPSKQAWLRRQGADPYVRKRLSSPANYRSRSAFKLIQLHDKWGRFLEHPDVKNVVDLGAAPGGWSQVVAERLGWVRSGSVQMENKNKRDERSGKMQTKPSNKLDRTDPLGTGSWSDTLDLKDSLLSDGHIVGRGKVIAVDLLPIQPIPGVATLQADFLSDEAFTVTRALLVDDHNPDGKADVILSDMAANMSGIAVRDSQSSLDICNAVIQFTLKNLRTAREIGRTAGGILVCVCVLSC